MASGSGLAEDVHWGYAGKEGSAYWGDLSGKFSACAEGRKQSPINFSGTASGGGVAVFDYGAIPLDVFNNGHTVEVKVEPGNSAVLAGKTYELLQFHFHSPSEHTVGGSSAAMEVHFVHRSSEGKLAVVSVLVEEGAANDTLGVIASHQLTAHHIEEGAARVPDETVNGSGLLPASYAFTAYSGSLTTPPCSEGVAWFVMKDSITATPGQIAIMQAAMPTNARPTQPLNDRLMRGSD
ncbi:MAG: carbonic anhydrase family protein [Alphaproteobacteria bacterium]